MSTKTAVLAVRIITDAKAGKAGLDDYGSSVSKLEKGLKSAALPAAALLGTIALLTKSAVDQASDLQSAGKAVDAVYQGSSTAVKKFADDAVNSAGLSASAYEQFAAKIGAELKNVGVSQDQLAPKTDQLISLGADLATQFGGSTSDAVSALEASLRGLTKPVAAYGVVITKAQVKTELAKRGQDKLTGSQLTAATAAATYTLVLQQTTSAQGEFAKSSDTAKGAQVRATAAWDDAQEKLGTALLPYLATMAGLLSNVAGFIDTNSAVILPLIGSLGAFAAAILVVNGAIEAWDTITTVAEGVQTAFDIILDANPISLLIIAIALLIGLIVVLALNWDKVSKAFSNGWDQIVSGAETALIWIDKIANAAAKLLGLGIHFVPGLPSGGGGGRGGGYPIDYVPGDDWGDDPSRGTGGWPSFAAGIGVSGSAVLAGDITNISVTGALDPQAVGRQIENVMNKRQRTRGVQTAQGQVFK